MLDKPEARDILTEVQAALKAGLAPGFQQAVAANAVAVALREEERAGAGHDAERTRLAALLGRVDSLGELNRALAHGIADGSIDAARDDVGRHLILTTLAKLDIDQPNYPAWRALREQGGEAR